MSIRWFRDAAREDRDPQRFDARVGHLFLVVECNGGNGSDYANEWWVQCVDPGFTPGQVGVLASGSKISEYQAKQAVRRAVKKIIRDVERGL